MTHLTKEDIRSRYDIDGASDASIEAALGFINSRRTDIEGEDMGIKRLDVEYDDRFHGNGSLSVSVMRNSGRMEFYTFGNRGAVKSKTIDTVNVELR